MEFDKQNPKLSLSAAVSAGEHISSKAYDFEILGTLVSVSLILIFLNNKI